ncbi:MAG: ribosomal L7Ae/L30e/S12e/Gadd45 family protein [Firmicutes bacterium]|nr:ribosomal L7Ae/L30e/S12e/Gadd45 family protein [Bacillota bacterium]
MDLEKNLGFLGLARKAGALEVGTDAAEAAIAKGKVKLLVLASDAGRSTVGMFASICKEKGVPVRYAATKDELGRALGRRQVAVAAVTGWHFAQQMLKEEPR